MPEGRHQRLVWFLQSGSALLCVRNDSLESGVATQRLEVGVRLDIDQPGEPQTVIHGVVENRERFLSLALNREETSKIISGIGGADVIRTEDAPLDVFGEPTSLPRRNGVRQR